MPPLALPEAAQPVVDKLQAAWETAQPYLKVCEGGLPLWGRNPALPLLHSARGGAV